MAFLLLRTREWVYRRVELIRFRDAENVQRQMSVDFALPWLVNSSVADMSAHAGPLVPLASLGKERLKRFSVWDEEGAAVPVLTSAENGHLAGACLVSVATQAWRNHTGDGHRLLPGDVADALRQIAETQPEAAIPMLADLPPGLLDDPIVKTLAQELAAQFVMAVRLEGARGERRVLKFSYEEPIRSNVRRNRFVRFADQTRESLGLKSHNVDFARIPVGHAGSHHVEVEAPAQVEFAGASLATLDLQTGETGAAPPYASDLQSDRVHLYVTGASRSTVGAMRVRFRAELIGLPLTAPALGALTAALLLLASSRVSRVSNEAGAAVLLLGPTLLAAFLAGPGEHPMATRLLLGVRVLVVGSGLTALTAAGALAAEYHPSKLECIWTWTTAASCLFALLLILGLAFRPRTSSDLR
jgi:hypothetical protein